MQLNYIVFSIIEVTVIRQLNYCFMSVLIHFFVSSLYIVSSYLIS